MDSRDKIIHSLHLMTAGRLPEKRNLLLAFLCLFGMAFSLIGNLVFFVIRTFLVSGFGIGLLDSPVSEAFILLLCFCGLFTCDCFSYYKIMGRWQHGFRRVGLISGFCVAACLLMAFIFSIFAHKSVVWVFYIGALAGLLAYGWWLSMYVAKLAMHLEIAWIIHTKKLGYVTGFLWGIGWWLVAGLGLLSIDAMLGNVLSGTIGIDWHMVREEYQVGFLFHVFLFSIGLTTMGGYLGLIIVFMSLGFHGFKFWLAYDEAAGEQVLKTLGQPMDYFNQTLPENLDKHTAFHRLIHNKTLILISLLTVLFELILTVILVVLIHVDTDHPITRDMGPAVFILESAMSWLLPLTLVSLFHVTASLLKINHVLLWAITACILIGVFGLLFIHWQPTYSLLIHYIDFSVHFDLHDNLEMTSSVIIVLFTGLVVRLGYRENAILIMRLGWLAFLISTVWLIMHISVLSDYKLLLTISILSGIDYKDIQIYEWAMLDGIKLLKYICLVILLIALLKRHVRKHHVD